MKRVIKASSEFDYGYLVESFYQDNFGGLADSEEVADLDAAIELAHEYICDGGSVSITNLQTGKWQGFTYDEYFDIDEDGFPGDFAESPFDRNLLACNDITSATKVECASGKGYLYITKHGLGPGTLPRGVKVNDSRELNQYLTAIWLDRFLTTKELNDYDIYPETGINDLLKKNGIDETWESLNASTKIIASAWRSPSGRKYGKQTRRFPGKYLFTRKELKQMVDNGDAGYIGGKLDPSSNYDIIGISWNDTNGHRTGILIKDRDTGELLVGNAGSALVARY